MRIGSIFLTFAGLALIAGVFGWAFMAGDHIGGGWAELAPIWPFVLGGTLVVGGLTGALMWLAFYSSSRGYDDLYGKGDDLLP